MDIIESQIVLDLLNSHPAPMRENLSFLRKLIFQTAAELPGIDTLEETLKWGEPGYTTKFGSTIRINQFKNSTTQYALYFNCKTKLIDTFKEVYRDTFSYEGNRAIIFNHNDTIAIDELKHCIELSLTYHKRKKLPLLGI